ncbi:MAG TPA: universal stress protein [Kofleriaceae bacterium]
MSFTKIMCPTDFSAGSRQAMRMAVRLATEADAELVLVHSWYVPPLALGAEYALPQRVIQNMVDDSQRGLEDAVKQATALGAKRVSSKFVTGVPWHEIVNLLDSQAFDLVVMGTQGRTGLSRVLLGSVAEAVIRHAPCSVLAIHPGTELKAFNHVLCPVDFSGSSEHAIELASRLAVPDGAGITLLHVVELPVAWEEPAPAKLYLEDLQKRSAELLAKLATRLEQNVTVPVTTQIRIGTPGSQALAALDEDPTFDLVVMGSHGRTGIKRVLLGSVAEKVVRHAKCPVLVARKRR